MPFAKVDDAVVELTFKRLIFKPPTSVDVAVDVPVKYEPMMLLPRMSPATESFWPGDVVPIPTLPVLEIRIRSDVPIPMVKLLEARIAKSVRAPEVPGNNTAPAPI